MTFVFLEAADLQLPLKKADIRKSFTGDKIGETTLHPRKIVNKP